MTTPKEALELKPCPFCGKLPKVSESGWHVRIHCGNEHCGGRVEVSGTERGIVLASWNTRATLSLQGEDAVEMVARIIDPEAFQEAFARFDPQLRENRRNVANRKARAILATGLVPDEAAIRADAIDPADLWDRYCDETDENFRTPQGAMAFAVAAIRSNGRGA